MYSNVNVFNLLPNAWSAGAALPVALTEMGAVALGDYVYVVGGLTGADAPSAAVYRLDTPLITMTWTGSASTDWYAEGNWTNGVPDVTKGVVVPGGRARYPVINGGTATARKMTLNAGARLNLTGGQLKLVEASEQSVSAGKGVVRTGWRVVRAGNGSVSTGDGIVRTG